MKRGNRKKAVNYTKFEPPDTGLQTRPCWVIGHGATGALSIQAIEDA